MALDRFALDCTALQNALFITDLKTGPFCPEEEDEISQSVVVYIFAAPQGKSFAVLIACPSKRDGILVHLTGCIETIFERMATGIMPRSQ